MMSYAFVITKMFDFVKAVMKPSPALNYVVFKRKILLMCPKFPTESIIKPVTNAHILHHDVAPNQSNVIPANFGQT